MPQPRTPQFPDTLERARYFPRQTVLPADLAQDREYLIHKARRHNRLLHGWGIWSGLRVELVPVAAEQPKETETDANKPDWERYRAYSAFRARVKDVPPSVRSDEGTWLAVAPGYALTPTGDEVFVPEWVFMNTASEVDGGLVTAPARCHSLAARKPNRRDSTIILVVDALEEETRPVRAASYRCGDHPDQFEFSRLEDVLRFRLLTEDAVKPHIDPYKPHSDPRGKENPPLTAEELAKELRWRAEVRRLTGDVRREYVRLAMIKFDRNGKVTDQPDLTPTHRDWFQETEPDKP